jgi:diphthamide biosynthesis enzyme Dph1/Dph2-like protein
MKTVFIPAKSKAEINQEKIKEISKKLPKNIAIAYSIQYEIQAKKIKQILEQNHKITKFIQVLGCSRPKFSKDTKSILLFSDGKFHAVSLAFETKLPVYLFENGRLEKISKKDIEILEKKQKSSYVNFLNSDKIGILISTKPGQQNLKKSVEIKNKLKGKKSYLFIANNINTSEFENFHDIQSWLNTACPRLDLESNKIVNMDKI